MPASDNSKASKKKNPPPSQTQKQEQRVPNEIGNAKDVKKASRGASADSVGDGDVQMNDGFRDMTHSLKKPQRNISKPGQYN